MNVGDAADANAQRSASWHLPARNLRRPWWPWWIGQPGAGFSLVDTWVLRLKRTGRIWNRLRLTEYFLSRSSGLLESQYSPSRKPLNFARTQDRCQESHCVCVAFCQPRWASESPRWPVVLTNALLLPFPSPLPWMRRHAIAITPSCLLMCLVV